MRECLVLRGVLFDSGGTLIGPIGGRWNPRFDFEEVLLRHVPDAAMSRFAAAIGVGEDALAAGSVTPNTDDYHRVILAELRIDPTDELLDEVAPPISSLSQAVMKHIEPAFQPDQHELARSEDLPKHVGHPRCERSSIAARTLDAKTSRNTSGAIPPLVRMTSCPQGPRSRAGVVFVVVAAIRTLRSARL